CVKGHIICSPCRTKLKERCPSCFSFIGNTRSRIMERLVEAVFFPCRNAKHGCTEKLFHGKELVDHEKECDGFVCYCPVPFCDYAGFDKNLYYHFTVCHKANYCSGFRTGQYVDVDVPVNMKETMLILQEYNHGPLVILQAFKGPDGLYVTANLLAAPCASRGWKFGYDLTCWRGNVEFTDTINEMNRIQRLSFETPGVKSMFIPYPFLDESLVVKMEIRISRIKMRRKKITKKKMRSNNILYHICCSRSLS
ncbi:hypothetical protein CARUB_v10020848mg, partial [Capsella rubella]